MRGKKEFRPYLEEFFKPFTGQKAAHVKRLVERNEILVELEWTGKNTGELPMPDGSKAPATGKTVTGTAVYYARVDDDGLIFEMRSDPDNFAVMTQLGFGIEA